MHWTFGVPLRMRPARRNHKPGNAIAKSGPGKPTTLYWRWIKPLVVILGLAMAYVVTARLGLLMALPPEGKATAVWAPSGIALVGILLFSHRVWPGIWLGAFLGNLWDYFLSSGQGSLSSHLIFSAGIAIGSTLQPLVGAYLIHHFMGAENPLDRALNVFLLIFISLLMCLIAATVGVALLYLVGFTHWPNLGFNWLTWWLGDSMGVLVITPLVLTWRQWPDFIASPVRVAEAGLLLIVLLSVALFNFGAWGEWGIDNRYLLYLTVLPLIWSASRFGQHGATFTLTLVLGIAIWGTAQHQGPWVMQTLNESLMLLQTFMGVLTITTLTLVGVLTERHQTEVSLKASGDRLRLSQQAGRVGVWDWDLPTDRWVLDGVGTVPGFEPPSFGGSFEDYLNCVHSGDRDEVRNALVQVVGAGGELDLEYRILRPDGSTLWIHNQGRAFQDDQGQTVRLTGTCQDIGRSKKYEELLRDSEEQQKALVAAIPDLLLQMGEDGTVQSANPGSSRLEHWASRACRGKQIDDLLPSATGLACSDHIHQAIQTGEVQSFERQIYVSNELLILDIRIAVAGKNQVVAIIRDVTKERRLEKQFLSSQKMESTGRLAGGIAHEFNNMLAAIIGFSHLALESSESNGEVKGYLKQSLQASERAADLVKRFLKFARSEGRSSTSFYLSELIMETDRLLGPTIGEDIELIILPAQDPDLVRADRNQIQQVLVNLVANARDAMPHGGKLVISTSSDKLDQFQQASQSGLVSGKFVVLAVTDTGIGMSDTVKSCLFEPFFTTKEVGEGTGLGLSVCYGLISQNGGHIEVDSALGQGTTFKVYLPKAGPGSEVTSPESDPESGYLLPATETVLLVEDEPLVRQLVSNTLRSQGYGIIEAANGIEALSKIQGNPNVQIDLVLSDLVMPRMGGIELMERLRKIDPEIKVLFMSGYAQGPYFCNFTSGSQVEFIPKPFSPNLLLSRVSEVLNSARDLASTR